MTAKTLVQRPRAGWWGYLLLLALGASMDVLSRNYPARMPFWFPWEFSWPIYLATTLSLAWFVRGLRILPASDRPAWWRIMLFILGVLSLWVALQTHVDYFAQHMFFVHRAQHFVLHHTGPFMIALGTAGPALVAGMPDFLKPVIRARPVSAVVDFIQHPVVAPVLFVGTIYLWLIPQFHTIVMLDADLYNVMNWSMVIGGIFFWVLILDSRPKPPARTGFGIRALLIIAVEPPQMVLGAILSLANTDYYPVYKICGRALNITAISDQHYGGLVIWLPGTFVSLLAILIVLANMRRDEISRELSASAPTGFG